MIWKKGKIFRKGNRIVCYIYKNGRKLIKKLVIVKKFRSNYRRRY